MSRSLVTSFHMLLLLALQQDIALSQTQKGIREHVFPACIVLSYLVRHLPGLSLHGDTGQDAIIALLRIRCRCSKQNREVECPAARPRGHPLAHCAGLGMSAFQAINLQSTATSLRLRDIIRSVAPMAA